MKGLWTWVLVAMIAPATAKYTIGVGIADVTGPPAEIAFMGYGKLDQKGRGIHLRQFSRAFIISDGDTRVVFVSVDCGMIGNGLRREIVAELKKVFGKKYTEGNVMLSGTHTHSTPGGYLQDLLFDLSTLGFVKETFESLVAGIVRSVRRAHDGMVSGRIEVIYGELLDVSVNRSPTAYLTNPPNERRKYQHNTDKLMTQMRFKSEKGEPLGVINWYAVHATSMNNTNHLVSSDNMGYAAILFEKKMNPTSLPGKGKFVAAFASSNLGDSSPNIAGPRCQWTGQPCDAHTSACPNKREECVAYGPGKNMFDSTKIIAQRLYSKASELWEKTGAKELSGPVRYVHQYVDMPTERTSVFDEKKGASVSVKGCIPAMGYSFAAGTTDGPGAFQFKQGTMTENPLWNTLRDFLARPSKENIRCHSPKPILLPTGTMTFPFEWQPRVVSTHIIMIGQYIITGVPGEFTTMAGRRLRVAVRDAAIATGAPKDTEVVIAGLCNTYSDYIVTYEEYQVQRYEGASTIFGPHTLSLYLNAYRRLVGSLFKESRSLPGPEPPELMNDLLSLQTPVLYDTPKWGHEFGDVLEQPQKTARAGDIVLARFVAANPRTNMMHGASYLTVDKRVGKRWVIHATDADWETKFYWERTSMILGNSEVLITWEVGPNVQPGEYRFRHNGVYKYIFGGYFPYQGSTDSVIVK